MGGLVGIGGVRLGGEVRMWRKLRCRRLSGSVAWTRWRRSVIGGGLGGGGLMIMQFIYWSYGRGGEGEFSVFSFRGRILYA
jgi:hypothetical protein